GTHRRLEVATEGVPLRILHATRAVQRVRLADREERRRTRQNLAQVERCPLRRERRNRRQVVGGERRNHVVVELDRLKRGGSGAEGERHGGSPLLGWNIRHVSQPTASDSPG